MADVSTMSQPGWEEGRWTSPGYRSSALRARFVQLFLGAIAGLAAVTTVLQVALLALIATILGGDASVSDAVDGLEVLVTDLEGLSPLLYLASAIAFLAWFSRSTDNVPPLGGGTPKTSPRWAIAWWFIPIASLWKPYAAMREIVGRLSIPPTRSSPRTLTAWWILWLASSLLGNVVARVWLTVGDASDPGIDLFIGAYVTSILSDATTVLAAILAIAVVRHVERLQTARVPTAPDGVPAAPEPQTEG